MFTILTDTNFRREVLDYPASALVEIEADWSGTSHIMAPVLEKLAHRYSQQLKIGKLNIDRNEEVPARYGVRDIPTLLLFKRGQLVGRIIGAVSVEELETQLLKRLLNDE